MFTSFLFRDQAYQSLLTAWENAIQQSLKEPPPQPQKDIKSSADTQRHATTENHTETTNDPSKISNEKTEEEDSEEEEEEEDESEEEELVMPEKKEEQRVTESSKPILLESEQVKKSESEVQGSPISLPNNTDHSTETKPKKERVPICFSVSDTLPQYEFSSFDETLTKKEEQSSTPKRARSHSFTASNESPPPIPNNAQAPPVRNSDDRQASPSLEKASTSTDVVSSNPVPEQPPQHQGNTFTTCITYSRCTISSNINQRLHTL